jgi:hypothetical protein
MQVFTLYSPKTADLLRLWALSWQRRGWKTRLLTDRELKKFGSVKKAMAGRKRAIFVPPTAINFGLSARIKRLPKMSRFPARGWESAPVVQFRREYEILNCGRHI